MEKLIHFTNPFRLLLNISPQTEMVTISYRCVYEWIFHTPVYCGLVFILNLGSPLPIVGFQTYPVSLHASFPVYDLNRTRGLSFFLLVTNGSHPWPSPRITKFSAIFWSYSLCGVFPTGLSNLHHTLVRNKPEICKKVLFICLFKKLIT